MRFGGLDTVHSGQLVDVALPAGCRPLAAAHARIACVTVALLVLVNKVI